MINVHCSFLFSSNATFPIGDTLYVIGRLITLVFALLKQDDEMLSHLLPGTALPEPFLYDPDLHKRHRTGYYRPIQKEHATNRIV